MGENAWLTVPWVWYPAAAGLDTSPMKTRRKTLDARIALLLADTGDS
jgi:hypothetical protein